MVDQDLVIQISLAAVVVALGQLEATHPQVVQETVEAAALLQLLELL
jgi:hypothetical protein